VYGLHPHNPDAVTLLFVHSLSVVSKIGARAKFSFRNPIVCSHVNKLKCKNKKKQEEAECLNIGTRKSLKKQTRELHVFVHLIGY